MDNLDNLDNLHNLESNLRPHPFEVLLSLQDILFYYQKDQLVLKNISFFLHPGESLGIIGPNGGGKSTLLKIIIGLIQPCEGIISSRGRVIEKGKYPAGTFAYVPQHTQVNNLMPLRVIDLLDLGGIGRIHPGKKELLADEEEILELVGLKDKRDRLISSLSGGEKQRALIAKALIHKPLILVLDEPHTGLDSTGQDQIFKILDHIKHEQGTSTIVVDHNLNQVIQHCDQLICLNKTSHWHDHKNLFTKKVLESIYHCEFEHLLIHENRPPVEDHHSCEHPEHAHQNFISKGLSAPPLPGKKEK